MRDPEAGAGTTGPFAVWGVATFTRDEQPFPTVAAMVTMAVAQLLGWAVVADLLPALG